MGSDLPITPTRIDGGIIPRNILTWLTDIYSVNVWREVEVLFILKAGITNHNTTNDYMPISLLLFLLKTLERLIELQVRLHFKEFRMAAFLDVDGTFNNFKMSLVI